MVSLSIDHERRARYVNVGRLRFDHEVGHVALPVSMLPNTKVMRWPGHQLEQLPMPPSLRAVLQDDAPQSSEAFPLRPKVGDGPVPTVGEFWGKS